MLTAPDRNDKKGKYHSTVNTMKNPSVFVTYLDAHAYPEYVITVSQISMIIAIQNAIATVLVVCKMYEVYEMKSYSFDFVLDAWK